MNYPPHLPPPSCSVSAHYIRRSLPWATLMLFLSVLAGVAAALGTAAWVLPETNGSGLSDRILLRRDTTPDTLEPYVLNQARARTVSVYDKTKALSSGAFPLEARLGEAMLLSSDGWAVLSSAVSKIRAAAIVAIDAQGVVNTIDAVVEDPYTDLVFVHLKGQGFRVAAFSNTETLPDTAWAVTLGSPVKQASVLYARETVDPTVEYMIDRPEVLPKVFTSTDVVPGSFLFDRRGDVVGVTAQKGVLYPSWLLEHHMRQVLQNGTITYKELGVSGRAVAAIPQSEGMVERAAFSVTSVSPRARQAGLLPGDILLAVNNVPLSFDTLTKQLLFSSDISVSIERKGVVVQVRIP